MPAVLLAALRTGVQFLVGALFTWLAGHGLNLPMDAQDQLVTWLVLGVGVAAWTAGVRWLETRKGDGVLARAARALARLLMLGLGGKQPVYVDPAASVRVLGSDGTITPVR